MKALLKVNFLIALCDAAHVHHADAQGRYLRAPNQAPVPLASTAAMRA